MTEPSLIGPPQPILFSDYDILHQQSLYSPNTAIIDNATIGLAGFYANAVAFQESNTDAWKAAGFESWANARSYPIDGYVVLVELDLLDKHGVAVCISQTDDPTQQTEKNYICFSASYDSAQTPPVTQKYTNVLPSSVSYNEASIAAQKPTLSQVNQYYDPICGDALGATYYGSGVNICWGISADDYLAPNDFIHIHAYLYLPKPGSDEATFGYRWQVGDGVYVRIIGESGVGNKQTALLMKDAAVLVLSSMAVLATILI